MKRSGKLFLIPQGHKFRTSRQAAQLSFIIFFCVIPSLAWAAHWFPLMINGKTLWVGKPSSRATIAHYLHVALPNAKPSVNTPDRIQYDYLPAAHQGPVRIVFDFDDHRHMKGVCISSSEKTKNPVARALIGWLRQQLGPGIAKKGEIHWLYYDFSFRLKNSTDSAGNSIQQITIDRR
jgi:hypothetical protein